MVRRISSFLAAAAILGLALPAHALGADREPFTRIVDVTAAPGTIAATVSPIPVLITTADQPSGVIRIDNISSLDEDIEVRVVNYTLDAAGRPVAAPADFAFGSAAWYRFDVTDFALASGTSLDVPFTVDVPATAGAGDHFAALTVMVEAQPGQEAAAPGGASARSVLVIQSRLQHRIAGADPQTPTVDLSARNSGGTVEFTARVGNGGNTVVGHQAAPTPTLVLYNVMPWGDPDRPERTIDVGGFYVAPRSARDVEVAWTDAPLFGRYRAVFTLPAADGQPPVVAETTLTVINRPVFIGVVAVLGVMLALTLWLLARGLSSRRRRRGASGEVDRRRSQG